MSSKDRTPVGYHLIPAFLFAAVAALYAGTCAPGTLFGDPSEYQFIPAILGIAHPPGYAFYTLLARVWQILVPLGSIAFRTNLLAAAVGAWVVTAAYLAIREIQWSLLESLPEPARSPLLPLLGALSLAAAPDLWQHAIHANAHIVSAALAITHLWLLLRWWRSGEDRWLALFAMTVGLAATHHPITLMGLPAYGLFLLAVRPRLALQWRKLLLLTGCLLLGLAPLLYFPLRSPSAPFGPTDMNTWEGFRRHATARGLRVNLFHFGLADQPDRAVVLWSLLRLQFPLIICLLSLLGLAHLARCRPRAALLLGLFVAAHLAFTLNTVQDVMAYLMLPFAALAALAGVGGIALVQWVAVRLARLRLPPGIAATLFALLLLLPLYQGGRNMDRGISLRDFTAAEQWVDAVRQRFAGRGEGAVLLSNWEHLTPLWVHTMAQGDRLDEEDVELIYVSAATPWGASVWQHIDDGPIYLPDYRPEVRNEGLRLLPEGTFYRVAAPATLAPRPRHELDVWVEGQLHVLGYDLPARSVRAGEPLELILYQSVVEPMTSIWMPFAQLGPVEARWTTDSRLLTPQWLPGETVVERYKLPVPFTLPAGEYPLMLGYADLSGGRPELELSSGETDLELAHITVLPAARTPAERTLAATVANLDNQIALMEAHARAGWQGREASWEKQLPVQAGDSLHLTLTWRALASPRDSYTVFIHLIDGAGRYVTGHDYTPLGGACPTYLWFPKWLPGQMVVDPYRLTIPSQLPSGDYWLEVGMYGMTSLRRLPVVDLSGNLAGDRIILGPVRVEGPR